ncbi:hypothetical protein CERZMDRAFT_91189 [Cercospora zeae-maydis SCOH1-5]|uniref:Hydrophobin n=1 Tax=Cercospora zeae-maydis SCOH1-5 TaxID=717836 RepID=A0A6A6FAQ6_9PEZI|nr:hypothetical protein CERZMDRAFT_91189 [Cercospora zeae-maydis SCOH1-5]
MHFSTALIAALASGALAAPQGNVAGTLLKTGTGALSGKGSPLGGLGGLARRQYGYASENKPAAYGGEKPVYDEHKPVYEEHQPSYDDHKDEYPAKEAYPVVEKPTYPTLTKYYAPSKPTYDATPAYPEGEEAFDDVPVFDGPVDSADEPVEEPADSATAISSQCGVGNAVSCCNTASQGDLLSIVLGGSCSLQIPVIAAALGNSCNAGNSFCCPTTQNGDINVGLPCIPINI